MTEAVDPNQDELEAAHCWEADDHVPRRPEMTAFRRLLRLHQARWREAHGHPMGTQPIVATAGKERTRPMGSRLPLDYARETGANFVTRHAIDAARARTSFVEARQSFDHQRLWADLLWSPALAFNLFGDLAADLKSADRAVHTWFPDAPGTVSEVRFAHSPGWLDPEYLNSLRAFDAVFILDRGDGTSAVVAVDAKYREWTKPEIARPENLARYRAVADRSHAFAPGATAPADRRWALAVMWLEHLLLLSMLQHASGVWSWGRYVVVHPSGNVDFAEACRAYRSLLVEDDTYAPLTLEDLLDADALPRRTAAALRERYLLA